MKAYCISDNTDTLMGMRLAGFEGIVLHERQEILDKLLKDRKGKIKDTFLNLGKLADITIYNKTKGLFDTKTLIATGLLVYGIKKFKNEMLLPSGATLIWWSYRLLTKNGN